MEIKRCWGSHAGVEKQNQTSVVPLRVYLHIQVLVERNLIWDLSNLGGKSKIPALCFLTEILFPHLFPAHTYHIGEAGGCVESHAGVVSSRTRDGAITSMTDFKQNLGN